MRPTCWMARRIGASLLRASPDRGEPMAFDAQYKVLPHWGTVAVSKAVPPLA
jgi:hypothetical protein